jgi:hypothetical protein
VWDKYAMTDKQLFEAAQIDIRYFLMAYKQCPTCGRKFEEMDPLENVMPHFDRKCKPNA